jgi:hypothetical protein
MENAYQRKAGQYPAGVREEVVPVAGPARAEELTQFQCGAQEEEKDHGRTNAAAAEALQIGEGGEDRVGGKVFDLIVDSTQVNQADYAALGGREAADDYCGEGNQPGQAEDAGEGGHAKAWFSHQI